MYTSGMRVTAFDVATMSSSLLPMFSRRSDALVLCRGRGSAAHHSPEELLHEMLPSAHSLAMVAVADVVPTLREEVNAFDKCEAMHVQVCADDFSASCGALLENLLSKRLAKLRSTVDVAIGTFEVVRLEQAVAFYNVGCFLSDALDGDDLKGCQLPLLPSQP